MPVGTQGTIKGLTSKQVEDLGCGIILGNTYHLGHRPGPETLKQLGGLHKLMNWKRFVCTLCFRSSSSLVLIFPETL